MAETVYLADGKMEVVLEAKDVFLERLLEEKLGSDVARFFRAWLDEQAEEQKDWEEEVKEKERIADGYFAMCHEAAENFQAVLNLLEQPRLDRKKIAKAAQIGYDALYKNL